MYAASEGRYALFVEHDNNPSNPREDSDNFGRMICWHQRYRLGDAHNYQEPADLMRDIAMSTFKDDMQPVINFVKAGKAPELKLAYDRSAREWALYEKCSFGSESKWYNTLSYGPGLRSKRISDHALFDIVHALSPSSLRALVTSIHGIVILPLYLYDHSVQSISTSSFLGRAHHAEWDSGRIGYVYADREMIAKEYGAVMPETIVKANALLEAEVKCYDDFLTGECYGFRMYEDGEETDSCWGFLGDFDSMKEEMRGYLPCECRGLVDKLKLSTNSIDSYLNHLESA